MKLPDLGPGYLPPHIPSNLLEHYGKYMDSVDWRNRRRKVLKRARKGCEMCRKYAAQHVHHITYERLFFERLTDLLAVCYTCHALLHPGNDNLAELSANDALWEDPKAHDPIDKMIKEGLDVMLENLGTYKAHSEWTLLKG